MKTAIYIEDGTVQLVITPESEFKKNAMSSFNGKDLDAKIFSGSFYDCRGGWVRQNPYTGNVSYASSVNEDRSIILQVKTNQGD